MKKVLSVISFLLVASYSQAENTFFVDNFEIKPGQEKTLSVILTNDSNAKSAAIDISLPTGISFVGDDGSVKFSDRVNGMTKKSAKIQKSGALRVGMVLGESIAAGTGEVFTFKIKADDNATLETKKISFSRMALTNASNEKVTIPYIEINVKVNNIVKIAVASNNNLMGSVQGANDESVVGSNATITATANNGYHFVNWTLGETEVSTDASYTFVVETEASLVANFAPNQYTMTFVLDNGNDNIVKTQDFATALSAPSDPQKTGFTFKGWDPEVPDAIPSSDQIFTAQWSRNSYKVTWIVDEEVIQEDQVLYDAEIVLPPHPYLQGYTFIDWTPSVAETMPATDMTYTGEFYINQYTMTFVLDNGEDDIVKTQDYASALTAPSDPQKTGFTFNGWDPAVPDAIPYYDQDFKAIWSRNSYKITWIADGDTTETGVLYDAEIVKPSDPQKDGYTFSGWTPSVAETMPDADLTYTAQFSINKYTMTFVLDNGEDDIVKTQDYASALTAPSDPQKTGFTFKGWDPAVPDAVPSSDQKFTAQWSRNSHKLTWIVDGDTTVTDVLYDAEIVKPSDPQKDGYTFSGWTPSVAETMPDADLTYTAQFSINKYTMTFVLDNGEDDIVKTQDYASALTAPSDPQKTGFTFKGWDPAVPDAVPSSDQKFTAQWSRNSHKLTWIVDGDTTVTDVLYDAEIVKPSDPQKDGYTFSGWTPSVAETMPDADLTYTAQFSINKYTMTFVLDNGEDDIVKTQDYASALTAPSDLQKTGFTFKGWDPAVPDAVPSSDQKFTAQWSRNSYKITWIADGDTTVTEVLYDDMIVLPSDPIKEGYTFNGWSEVPARMPSNDLEVIGTFTVNKYLLTVIIDDVVFFSDSIAFGTRLADYLDLIIENGIDLSSWEFYDNLDSISMPAHDVVINGIKSAVTPILTNPNGSYIYDMKGNRIMVDEDAVLPSGIYIRNGRKYMVW